MTSSFIYNVVVGALLPLHLPAEQKLIVVLRVASGFLIVNGPFSGNIIIVAECEDQVLVWL